MWLVLAFSAGIGFKIVFDWATHRQALALYGAKGQQVKREQQDELLALIGDVALQFKEAKEKGEDLKAAAMRILPAAAAAHPAATMKLAGKIGKQFLSGKGKGFEGLGGLLE